MDTITRQDQYFDAMSGGSSEIPEPITRKEQYYAKMAGEDVDVPEPITREEFWLHKIIEHGGGGGTTTIEPLTVTANGTYSETGKAYSPVNVSVPTPSGSTNISANGTYDVTAFAEAVVNVSGGGGLEYETGVWIPASAVSYDTISFNKQHDTPPAFVMVVAIVEPFDIVAENTSIGFIYSNWRRAFNATVKAATTTLNYFGTVEYLYRLTNTSISALSTQLTTPDTHSSASSASASKHWVDESHIKMPTLANNAYWRPEYTYKWIAIWAPTE